MTDEEIEKVARVLIRRMYDEETSRKQEEDDTGLWKVVKEDARAAITALDQHREGKAKEALTGWPSPEVIQRVSRQHSQEELDAKVARFVGRPSPTKEEGR